MLRAEQFTEQAQNTARRAFEVIQRYGHGQVETEHLLLAILDDSEGVIPRILEAQSVDLGMIKQRLDDVLRTYPTATSAGPGDGQVYISPGVKQMLDLANEEANRRKDDLIGTKHIFLAMLSERNTATVRLLSEAGLAGDELVEWVRDAPSDRQ
jgi:ATP-dependent Clp protease ATP-binding subunit ClpC